MHDEIDSNYRIPFFGARKTARKLLEEVIELRTERDELTRHLARLGALDIVQLARKRALLLGEIDQCESEIAKQRATAKAEENRMRQRLNELQCFTHREFIRNS
jgi:hypothetical protein